MIKTKFDDHYQVVVCGGGTAGAPAAIAAAAAGLRVLCVETGSFMGGMGSGVVMGYYHGENMEGMFADIDREIKSESESVYSPKKAWCEGIHSEAKKYIFEKKYMEFGGVIWYYSIVTDVFTENKKVIGLRILKDGLLTDIGCDYIIDATSEANICRIAGLPMKIGRDTDGQCQAYSAVCLTVNENGELEHIYRDNGYVNDSDMVAFSRAVTHSYADSDCKGAYSKQNNKIVMCAPILGKREGMCSVGIDSFTGENLLCLTPVSRPVFTCSGPYDTHLHDAAMESDTVNDFLMCDLGRQVVTVRIPYGAMLPEGIDGLITAGLGMDIYHDALAPVRLKKNMVRSGETAAVIAITSLRTGRRPLDCYEEVKQELIRRKVYFPSAKPSAGLREAMQDIKSAMSREINYGWGIYAAVRTLSADILKEYLDSCEIPLKKNAAIALALLGDNSGAAILKEMENEKTVYLLGKLNRGEYTEYIAQFLRKDTEYALFAYAFAALLRGAKRGDKKAKSILEVLVQKEDFAPLLVLNGNDKKASEDRSAALREFYKRSVT